MRNFHFSQSETNTGHTMHTMVSHYRVTFRKLIFKECENSFHFIVGIKCFKFLKQGTRQIGLNIWMCSEFVLTENLALLGRSHFEETAVNQICS